ncbi:MAG: DUF5993 family protein [Burkholderiales bacterium]|nr:DUF5993 family protein [Burkholderiales bacterium]
MAFLFLFLLIPCIFAVSGKYNLAKITFWVFLIALGGTFIHHITDSINIQL